MLWGSLNKMRPIYDVPAHVLSTKRVDVDTFPQPSLRVENGDKPRVLPDGG